MSRITTAVSRRIVGGSTQGSQTADIRSSRTTGQTPVLQRAVVIEVFDNPSALTEEQKQALVNRVSNPDFIDILPVNAILARIVSDSQDSGSSTGIILFPFFSSCMILPVVPGEHVQVMFPDQSHSGNTLGYWMCRVQEQGTVEDVNYSVHDRRFLQNYNPQNRSTSERSQESSEVAPGFPNGAGTESTRTLRITGSNAQNPYDGIIAESVAIRNFTFEPVPRLNKRPGEFVLQGKNNSTIILGEDRTGPVLRATADAIGTAGSIDMVAGRGRKLPDPVSSDPEETAPRLIQNSRSQREVNKTPYMSEGRQNNPREGDPDFTNDAARILITMQSEADKNFGVTQLSFPEDVLVPVQPKDGTPGTLGKSYVVAKADNIRLIARKDDDVDGTILIIREGASDDEMAYFYIDDAGEMQLYSPKMYFGKSTGETEPYIKYTKYKDAINNLQSQIDALKTFCDSLTTTLQTAFASAMAIPYSPIVGLSSQISGLVSNKTSLATSFGTKPNDTTTIIDDSKSSVIFGE